MSDDDAETVPVTLKVGTYTQRLGHVCREDLACNLRPTIAIFLRQVADELDALEREEWS